jgi:hypothetical protein
MESINKFIKREIKRERDLNNNLDIDYYDILKEFKRDLKEINILNKNKAFNIVYGENKNFITPYIIGYIKTPKYDIEISRGEIFNKNIYGITILDKKLNKLDNKNYGGGYFQVIDKIKVLVSEE